MESQAALPSLTGESPGRGWPLRLDSRPTFWFGYGLSVLLTAAAIGLGSSPSLAGPLGPASPSVLTLLGVNLALILGLSYLVGTRILRLMGEQTGDPGARLHLRFVGLFAVAAVLPALVVMLFFGVLVTRGVDSWFNAQVEDVVENSAKVAVSYLDEQGANIRD